MSNIKYYRGTTLVYFSPRYKKYITVPKGYPSDGATGAIDIDSDAWWVHDKVCDDHHFDDGTFITSWQASMILRDMLKAEGRWIRKRTWFWSTLFFTSLRW